MRTISIIENLIKKEPKEKQDIYYMLLSFLNNENNDITECNRAINKVLKKNSQLYHYCDIFARGYYNIKTNYIINNI